MRFSERFRNRFMSPRASQGGETSQNCRKRLIWMVARDGTEPPTPAFSGPRSTTELSGLGTKNALCRGSPRTPGRIAFATPAAPVLEEGNQPFKRFLSIATNTPSRQHHVFHRAALSCFSPAT